MNIGVGAVGDDETTDRIGQVISYYHQTDFDYRIAWLNSANLALHFGYYEDGIYSHAMALENTNRVLAGLARVRPGDRVLDAGCGLGGSSCWLAAKRGASVIGITPVTFQVDQARHIAALRGLSDRVSFECADYTGTPFPDASFDVVWALESLCHTPNKPAFYKEASRLLRPGGRLIVAEYMRTSRGLPAKDEALIREWLGGWMIPDLDTGTEHVQAAMAAGLDAAEMHDNTVKTRRSLRRLYIVSRVAQPIDAALHAARLRSSTQHGNVIASIRQYQALRNSLWFYGILSAVK
jgi:tocopherol O-methyltransferase